MDDDLRSRVDDAIDETIRFFDSREAGSYEHWDGVLKSLEEQLAATIVPERDGDDYWLSRLSAHRIRISFEAGNVAFGLLASRSFIDTYPPSNPSFFVVANIRAHNLHLLGSHDDESMEILEIVQSPDLGGREFLLLLESLAARHPGVLKDKDYLRAKLRDAVELLRSQGYEDLPPATETTESMNFEQLVLKFTGELRKIDQAYTEAILGREGI